MKKKLCPSCSLSKSIKQFTKDKNRIDNLSVYCKECYSIKRKIWWNKNRQKMNKKQIESYHKDKTKYKKGRDNYYKKNKNKILAKNRQYYEINKSKIISQHNAYTRQKRKINPSFKVLSNIRRRIHLYLGGKIIRNNKSIIELLGCDIEYFWLHMEKQFKKGMTRKNYGKWHIDHIIPLSSAQTTVELEKLFHYTNCQPLWAKENLRKSNKI